jgi:hypothetical protein
MSTAVQLHGGEPTALAPSRPSLGLIRPIAAPAEVLKVQEETRAMLAEILQEGRDYGVIPGTDRPSMLKPGAERVALAFGCMYGEPEIVEHEIDHDRVVEYTKRKKVWKNEYTGDRRFDWEESTGISRGLYRYVLRVPVIHRESGQVVGNGIGSCSTMESKYIDRPRDSENTALKMAHKRALIAAGLITFGLSDQFTQDTEDLPPEQLVGENAPKLETLDPPCPKCAGKMHDNRLSKKNAKAPDFKCRDKKCDGVYWPGQAPGAAPAVALVTPAQRTRIHELLAVADLNDGKKAETIALLDDTVKPLTESKAAKMIEKLEKLAAPVIDASHEPSETDEPADAQAGVQGSLVNADGTLSPAGTRASALEPREGKDGKAGKAAPTSADESVVSLTKRITTLLADRKLDESERAILRTRLEGANDTAALLQLLADVEETISGLPF